MEKQYGCTCGSKFLDASHRDAHVDAATQLAALGLRPDTEHEPTEPLSDVGFNARAVAERRAS